MDTMTRMESGLSEFVTSRVFDAPVKLVWQSWTESDRLMQWFSPQGYLMVHAKLDLRPGRTFLYALRGPDGNDMWGKWLFREIVPQERLVMVISFSNPEGGMMRHPLAPGWPLQILTTATFAEENGKTTVTVHWVPLDANEVELKIFAAGYESMKLGWSGTFDQLAAYLASKQHRGDEYACAVPQEEWT